MIAGLFEPPAALLAWFYSFTHNYIIAIAMIALVVMLDHRPADAEEHQGHARDAEAAAGDAQAADTSTATTGRSSTKR